MASKTQALMLLLLPLLLILSHLNSSQAAARCPIVTYWGQNGTEGELNAACDTGNYKIINIAFMNQFGSGRTPNINLAGHCNWNTPTGVPDCTGYASQIAYCQQLGVKIFLSLGGANGQYTLSSADDAKEFAGHLWTYYLSGQSPGLLGLVALDGIDFDIEQAGGTLYWDDLAEDLYAYSQIKKVYLSAAPQCPIPDYMDAAIRTGRFDYIWVQFYNNRQCEYTDDGDTQKLISSWNQWTTTFTATKFYVGLPASPDANGTAGGYVPIDKLNNEIIPKVETSSKFGGVMLWNYNYDKTSGYSGQIICHVSQAFNVVPEPLVAMMKSASEVLYRLLSQF